MPTDYTSLEEGAQKAASTFESTQSEILQSMLQTTFSYAGYVPDKVHVYFQITEGRAAAEFLFEIAGKVLEVGELDQTDVELDFVERPERQQQLTNNIAQELLRFINHYVTHDRPFPTEVWTSVGAQDSSITSSTGYSYLRAVPESKEAMRNWKKDLEDPSYLAVRKLAISKSAGGHLKF